MFNTILILIIAYFLGSIPTGYLLSLILTGKDIRSSGSGSTGATNVVRSLGFKFGVLTFIIDFIKGYIAVWISSGLMQNEWDLGLACLMVVIGHCYPIFLSFKGGKGVATAAGVVSFFSLPMIICLLVLFFLIFHFTKTVSIGSMVVVAVGLIYSFFLPLSMPVHICLVILAAFIVFRHRSNIKRLMGGNELSFK